MVVTEKLARYILFCQNVVNIEIGLDAEDYEIRRQLEEAFPVLRRERDSKEFRDWLWTTRVEQEQEVKNARALLKGLPGNPGGGNLYEQWSRKHDELIGQLDSAKQTVEVELLRSDAAGDIDLQAEFKAAQRNSRKS